MDCVTVSPKFQIVIPVHVREQLGVQAGMKFQVIPYKGRIELVPVRPLKELFGALPGLDTRIDRDEDDRV